MYYRALCCATPTEPPSITTGSFPHWNITEEENTHSPLVSKRLSHRFSNTHTSYSHYTCECYQQCETPRPTGLDLWASLGYTSIPAVLYSSHINSFHSIRVLLIVTRATTGQCSPRVLWYPFHKELHIAMGSGPSKEHQGSSTHAALLGQEELAEPVILESSRYVVVALYNYPNGHPANSSIRAGERINVLSDEGEWWKVRSSATGNESYIPSSYTARVYHRCQYEGLSRKKAEELLLLPNNQTGSFLVRESQTRPGAHSLSVRKTDDQDRCSVKHYRIQQLENGWHFISPCLTFPTLTALVDHYSEVTDGLCCLLGEPCFIQGSNSIPVATGPIPMAIRKSTLNWKDADSSMIFGKVNEDSLVSEGLREAISSYLFMTGDCSLKWDS